MRMMILGMALATGPALAQDAQQIKDVVAEFDGREVRASGYFEASYTAGDPPMFRGDGTFWMPVDYALSRSDLQALTECAEGREEGSCRGSVSAEFRVNGSQIKLLIYEVAMEE
jgi:hypothetical protein